MAAPRRRTERSESAAERARKKARPTDSRRTFTTRRRKGAQSAAPRFCGRLLEKNKRGKTPRPNRLAEQKTALLCAFLPFSLFCKAFSKFS